jgi:cell shape-determining protein MreC
MPHAKSNHLFFGLMALAGVSAFLIPAKYTDRVVPQLQLLFFPFSAPVRGVAAWAHGREEQLPPDDRASYAIRLENDRLRQQNVKLRYDLVEQLKITNELKNLGDLGPLCTPVKVVGSDPGQRESLALAGSSLEGLKDDMCVVYPGGIVGRLQRTGLAGGQVQLVTNPGFRVTAYFSAVRRKPDGKNPAAKDATGDLVRLNNERVLVEGAGRGQMVVRHQKMSDVQGWGLQKGDWVVLDDTEWPPRLRGLKIGRVASITTHRESPLFAEIKIAPDADLLKLQEVMVLTKN